MAFRKRSSAFLLAAVTASLVAAVLLLGRCSYDRWSRSVDSEAMRLGAEDVARRIEETQNNLAHVKAFYNESAISAARIFARFVADDPSLLEDHGRFAAMKKLLGVDELHVSDSNGVLIASEPVSSKGYMMGSHAQSAAFMPAITNRAFELVQKPMIKGIEYKLFQYAGVARIDEPGIVQIGLNPGRLEEATSVADVGNIAATTRIGRGGEVSIISLVDENRTGDERDRFEVFRTPAGRKACLQKDCGDWRIIVTMPYRGWLLADDQPYSCLVCAVFMLLIAQILIAIWATDSHGIRSLVADLAAFFGSLRGRSRIHPGPVLLLALAVFTVVLCITWKASGNFARSRAEKNIIRGARDFTDSFSYAADDCLFFVGKAIVSRFPSAEILRKEDLKKLLAEYGIDELNVVDEKGLLVGTTMEGGDFIGQDQWSLAGPREFCERLITGGAETFSQPFRESASEKGVVRMYAGVSFPHSRGYVQLGFDEKRVRYGFDYGFAEFAEGWAVGETGYFLLARNSGEVVSCGNGRWKAAVDGGRRQTLAGIGLDVTLVPSDDEEDRFFEAMLYGERCLCYSSPVGNYHRMFAVIPCSEIESGRNSTMMLVGGLFLVVLGLCAVFGTRLYDVSQRLREFIVEDKRRRDEELKNAKAIQTESLPTVFPDTPGFSIRALMDTAKEVGGDFYDFYTLPSGRQLFLIADTSGKGIPAAMFMMKAKAVVRAGLFETPDFAEAIREANARLAENNDANMFVTAWIGVFDPSTGVVEFVNCGHNPPLVKHADGSVSWVRTRPGLALAAMPGVRYRVETLTLGRGESLFLYTDGVTEAMNAAGEQYGEKRLESDFAAVPRVRFIENVRARVAEFVAGAEQSDDITMLSLERKE